MSGGAAVLEAIGAIAALGLPVRVRGGDRRDREPARPAARVKPGDIVRAMAGTTIEINNTDAEGRLVLADCLAHALDLGAERLVDLATLTGAIVVALGRTYAGLFGNDDAWASAVARRGRAHRRARLAPAAARRVRQAGRGPLRRHRQLARAPRGGLDQRRPSSCTASPATCPGRTWTSPAPPGTSGAPYAAKGGVGLGRAAARRARPGAAAGVARPPLNILRDRVRLAGLWILLVAAYAATLGIPAQLGTDYAGNEPHHLLAAESIVSDRDVDLADEYRERSYAGWYPRELRTDGRVVGGRLMEPHGVGYALLIAPAYAIGGARAVQGQMLVLLALAFVLAAALARRMVPEPWATAGAALVGLSPPALAAATTITPSVPAAVLLAAAALCALAVRERPRLQYVVGGALLLAGLPWLGWTFVLPGVIVAWALVTWTLRERRRLAALVAGEALAGSLVFYATVNDRFYGGLTPRSAATERLPELPLGYLERLPRLAGLWLDREVGLLRWAPLLALVFYACWLLYCSRRDQLARVAPARREAEACAALLLAVAGADVVVVALFSPGPLRGAAFPGVTLVATLPALAALSAWALRHVPRTLAGVLALLTLGASTWLVLAGRGGRFAGWLDVDTNVPWGPPVAVFPDFTGAAPWPALACALIAAALAALWRRERRAAGKWRRAAAASRTSKALH